MIYFDSAATTLQKPETVATAMCNAVCTMASPGRGGHKASMLAADTAYQCREAAAELFNVEDSGNIIFTFNATHGLNIAIKSIVEHGDRVIISGYEHNSVVRPLEAIGAQVKVAEGKPFRPKETLRDFAELIERGAELVVCNHMSNVFGCIQPVKEIAALCHEYRIPFILDASQSAGVLSIDAKDLDADFIAMPGHKGLYGPQGTGILICKDLPEKTLMEGGSGSNSISRNMPEFLPDRLEAGTHNMPGISGLLAGIGFVSRRTPRSILCHEQELVCHAVSGMREIKGVRVYTPYQQCTQAGVLSFNLQGADCEAISEELGRMDVAVRAGLHCAPLAHKSMGTLDTGTVRLSFSAFNTKAEVDRFLCILEYSANNLRKS